MPERKLRESLEALRAEIQRLEAGDAQARERLDALIAELEARLEHPDDAERHEDLVRSVSDAIAEFEVSHPRATGILNHIMVTLSNMGI